MRESVISKRSSFTGPALLGNGCCKSKILYYVLFFHTSFIYMPHLVNANFGPYPFVPQEECQIPLCFTSRCVIMQRLSQ